MAAPARAILTVTPPATGLGFYYGGPAIVLNGAAGLFLSAEHVNVYLGTGVTGTLLVTNAVSLHTGGLKATVPVPQVIPGSYVLTAVGQTSGLSHTGTVTIVPVLRPSVTQGASGTPVSLSGAGFLPGEAISITWGYGNAANPGQVVATTLADGTGAFVYAAFVPSAAPGLYHVAGIGASGDVNDFTYVVAPVLSVEPILGPPGQALTATGSGYTTTYPIALLWNGTSLAARLGLAANSGGSFAMYTATVPSNATARTAAYPLYAAAWSKSALQPYGAAWFTVVAPGAPSIAIAGTSATPSGSPGGPLTIAGVNWAPQSSVGLYWGGTKQPTTTNPITSVTAAADGSLAATVPLTTAVAGTYYVWAISGASVTKAAYKIAYTPHVSLGSITGAYGYTHTLAVASGGGFDGGETVSFTLKSPSGAVLSNATATAQANGGVGGGAPTFSLASTAISGTYSVAAYGVSSKAQTSATYKVTSVQPTFSLSTLSGWVGSAVQVTGTGWLAGEFVSIRYNTGIPGTGWVTLAKVVTKALVRNGPGAFGAWVVIPPTSGGVAEIDAVGMTSGATLRQYFRVSTVSCTLTPTQGNPGTPVLVNGAGFEAGKSIALRWVGAVTTSLGSAIADSNGAISTTITVPLTATPSSGVYTVDLLSNQTNSHVTATFTVLAPTASLSPSSANAGATVAVTGTNFGDGETVNVSLFGSSGQVASMATGSVDANGNASASLTVPGNLAPGVYTGTVTGATTGLSACFSFTRLTPTLSVTPQSISRTRPRHHGHAGARGRDGHAHVGAAACPWARPGRRERRLRRTSSAAPKPSLGQTTRSRPGRRDGRHRVSDRAHRPAGQRHDPAGYRVDSRLQPRWWSPATSSCRRASR